MEVEEHPPLRLVGVRTRPEVRTPLQGPAAIIRTTAGESLVSICNYLLK